MTKKLMLLLALFITTESNTSAGPANKIPTHMKEKQIIELRDGNGDWRKNISVSEINELISSKIPYWGETAGDGETLLHMAAELKNTDVAKLLINGVPPKERTAFVMQGEYGGDTALNHAANFEMVELLVNSIPDKTKRSEFVTDGGCDGFTSLHSAASHGDIDRAKFLIKNTEPKNVESYIFSRTNGVGSALHAAASNGHAKMVSFLIHKITDPKKRLDFINAGDDYGCTALHLAARYGCVDVAKLLTDSIWTFDNDVQSALHTAVTFGQKDMVKFLIQSIPDVGKRSDFICRHTSKYYETALHIAARYGYLEIAKLLLEGIVDPKKRHDFIMDTGENGKTAADLASIYGKKDMEKLLKVYS